MSTPNSFQRCASMAFSAVQASIDKVECGIMSRHDAYVWCCGYLSAIRATHVLYVADESQLITMVATLAPEIKKVPEWPFDETSIANREFYADGSC